MDLELAKRIEKLPQWARNVIEDLQDDYRLAKALRWTDYDETRDVPPPKSFEEANSQGYDIIPGRAKPFYSTNIDDAVEWSHSTATSHGFGDGDSSYASRSQGARSLYSTKLKAWQALRRIIERDCAKMLAAIDEQIEKHSSS